MLQISTFGQLGTQAGHTVKQIASCLNALGSSFEQLTSFDIVIDEENRIAADVAV